MGAEQHEVLRVLAERARTGSREEDGARVALAIEGGAMRGTISGGMALALHELGLVSALDAVYGSSAGAISGAWLLSSRPEGLRGWTEPAFAQTLIRRYGPLRGRPVADVRALVEEVYQTEFPLDFESVLASPVEYHPLATDAASGRSTDLRPLIEDAVQLRLALRASAAMPLLAGPPVILGGRRFYDAGVSESVPYRTALGQGATHVLVLRSRREPVTSAGPSREARLIASTALRRESMALRAAFLVREARLTADDTRLARYDRDGSAAAGPAWVLSIRPAADSPEVSRLATDGPLLLAAFEAGRAAVHAVFAGNQASTP
jgi:predicted patatin/cPLA2 family phospholipase